MAYGNCAVHQDVVCCSLIQSLCVCVCVCVCVKEREREGEGERILLFTIIAVEKMLSFGWSSQSYIEELQATRKHTA